MAGAGSDTAGAVIVAAGTPATQAARAATATIPIVMTAVGDPVGSGIVASLGRPGGNITGLSLLDAELDGKRIEILKEAVPGLTRIAMLWSPSDPGMTLAFGRVAPPPGVHIAVVAPGVADPPVSRLTLRRARLAAAMRAGLHGMLALLDAPRPAREGPDAHFADGGATARHA